MPIPLAPPVASNSLELSRVQQRYDGPLQELLASPWGSGVLLRVLLKSAAGTQSIVARHGLGRAVTGAVVWMCNVQVSSLWGLLLLDSNTCSFNVNLPVAVPTGVTGKLDLWVG